MGAAYTNPKTQNNSHFNSLKRFEEGQSRRVFDIITGDEFWFYHDDRELKEQ